MGNKTLCVCIGLLCLIPNAWAKHNEDTKKIPFNLYRNHLVVARGRLGQIENRNLLIDTGASPTVVDEALAHELGLKPVGRPVNGMAVVGGVAQTYYAVLEGLDLGPLHRNSLIVAVANLSLLQAEAGLRIDAILGLDTLEPTDFQIDYFSRHIVFGGARLRGAVVPMKQSAPFVIIDTEVNSVPVNLAIDTGTSELVLFRNGLPTEITARRPTTQMQLANVAGEVLAPEIQLSEFHVGSVDLSGSTAVLTTVPNCCEFQGIFGISALHFSRVTFDFTHHLLGLEEVSHDNEQALSPESCSSFPANCQSTLFRGFAPPSTK